MLFIEATVLGLRLLEDEVRGNDSDLMLHAQLA